MPVHIHPNTKFKILFYFRSDNLKKWNLMLINIFEWYLIPTFKTGNIEDVPYPKNYNRVIYLPKDSEDDLHAAKHMVVNFKYRDVCFCYFLCFEIKYTVVRYNKDLINTYGVNYNHKKETLEGAKEKYNKLLQTEFFH